MASKLSRLFGKGQSEALPPYAYRYLDHVLGDLTATLKAEDAPPAYVGEIRTRADAARKERLHGLPEGQPATSITWSDIHMLERYLLSRETVETLRRRAWFLRLKYREVVGQRAYDAYLASQPPSDVDATEAALRADLERLLSALHRSYTLLPLREQMRTGVIRAIGKWLLIVLLISIPFVVFFATTGQTLIAMAFVVALAGAAGGFMSLQQRIQHVPTDGDPLISIFELQNGLASIYLAPISGAVFAVLLFFIFMAKLVEGALFPNIAEVGLTLRPFWPLWPDTVSSYLLATGQESTQTYAKLLVWSFIAGFAERFVPDTITRLVERGNASGTSSSTVTTTVVTKTSPGVVTDADTDVTKEAGAADDSTPKDEKGKTPDASSGSAGQGTAESSAGQAPAQEVKTEAEGSGPDGKGAETELKEATAVGEGKESTQDPDSKKEG
jgi:hypothetical protein